MYRVWLTLAAACAIAYVLTSGGTPDGFGIAAAAFAVFAVITAPIGRGDDDA